MNRSMLAAIALLLLLLGRASDGSDDWNPAAGPLMTRWAKDVSPDNVHPEYPRPQMVRADWLNLNRLWQLEMGKADDVCVSR